MAFILPSKINIFIDPYSTFNEEGSPEYTKLLYQLLYDAYAQSKIVNVLRRPAYCQLCKKEALIGNPGEERTVSACHLTVKIGEKTFFFPIETLHLIKDHGLSAGKNLQKLFDGP